MELPRVGITTLDDLLSRTKEKKELDELALRLLVPKEIFVQWIEKARLVQVKALGIKNLRLLEDAGINSISDLAKEDPGKLYEKIREFSPSTSIPTKAKIRIWIREARKEVRT
jgi:predicted RecB family nuclease